MVKTGMKRVLFLDFLRACTPLAVVALHVLGAFEPTNINSIDFYVEKIILGALCFAVPIFLMISGSLMLDPAKSFDYRKFFKKNVTRIFLILVVWILVFACLQIFFKPNALEGHNPLGFIILSFSKYRFYHLWYLVPLLALYLLTPVLRKVAANERLLEYVLMIGIVFGFALPSAVFLLKVAFQNGINGYPSSLIETMVNHKNIVVQIGNFLGIGYAVYYLLGYYLRVKDFKPIERKIIYIFGLVGLVVAGLLFPVMLRFNGEVTNETVSLSPWIMALAVAIFVFIKQRYARRKSNPKIINFMAKYSLGVYLTHPIILNFILPNFYDSEFHLYSMLLLIPLFTIGIYLASLLLAWILNKIPIVRRVV